MIPFAGAAFGVWMSGQALSTGSLFVAAIPLVVTLLFVGIGLFYWTLGSKVATGQWRTLQLVAGALALPTFPIGTIYGGYALWVMLSDKGNGQFKEAESLRMELDPF